MLPSAVLSAAGVLRSCVVVVGLLFSRCPLRVVFKTTSKHIIMRGEQRERVCGLWLLTGFCAVAGDACWGPADFSSACHSARSLRNLINQSTNEQKKQKPM
eukprot:INCI13461.4.p2 GENE.INCI13461.4~~INCI13461.4.p2  ORF type:complete len:101 (-),score=9.34 INCI13461.4:766-1068(-)